MKNSSPRTLSPQTNYTIINQVERNAKTKKQFHENFRIPPPGSLIEFLRRGNLSNSRKLVYIHREKSDPTRPAIIRHFGFPWRGSDRQTRQFVNVEKEQRTRVQVIVKRFPMGARWLPGKSVPLCVFDQDFQTSWENVESVAVLGGKIPRPIYVSA